MKRGLVTAFVALAVLAPIGAEPPPKVKVSNIRRVFHNGEHNAFTDLIRFRDRFYLTFRSCPDGHGVHSSASVIILASDDAAQWEQVHRFRVEDRDTRDPHFLIFKNKLFVYSGTWYCKGPDLCREDLELNEQLGYAVWSLNGREWSDPVLLEGTLGHYIWRANTFAGKAFLCGRRKINFSVGPRSHGQDNESAMLESDDGLIWRKRALFQETEGNETAFQFESDGSIVAVARRRGHNSAQLCRSSPPYVEWERKDLNRYIGGPLLARWGDRYIAGGRKRTEHRGPKTSLYWLDDDRLVEFAELPSAGDNSYPGFVELSPTRGLLSWYSSHEKDAAGQEITAIYMADLAISK